MVTPYGFFGAKYDTIVWYIEIFGREVTHMKKKLILVDGYSLFFRAYYATAYTGQFMNTSEGLPTNAIFSFSNMLFRILSENTFSHILVALDPGGTLFRHDLLPEYKGTRAETPKEMLPQFDLLPELLEALNIKYHKEPTFEADDIIGTLAREAEQKGFEVDVLSSDRDLLQLLDEHTRIRLLKKGLSEIDDMTVEKLHEEMEITPAQVTDLKGLMGDSSDNIPGIPGVGPKTALKLLHEYGTIENIYRHIDDLKGKQKEKFIVYETQARLSKLLATIECNLKLSISVDDLEYPGIDLQAAQQFFRKIESKTLVKKAQSIYDEQEANKNNGYLDSMDGLLADVVPDKALLSTVDTVIEVGEEAIFYLEHPYENYHQYQAPLYVGIKDENNLYLFDWGTFLKNKSAMAWLANPVSKKVVFDSKKLAAIALYHNLEVAGVAFDIMLAAYIMNPGNKVDEIADVAQIFEKMLPFQENIYGKGAKFTIENAERILEYTKEATEMCAVCQAALLEELADADLLNLLHAVEMPVAQILAEMEVAGIRVDAATLKSQGAVISARIKELEESIWELAGETFNIGSPKQLGVILFEKLGLPVIKKTKTGYSTAANVLDELALEHAIIPLIGEYRQLTKLDSTYIKGLVPMIAADGRIHTIYKQANTQTGRLSSIEPNLQNIPIRLAEGRLIRKAFVPDNADCVLLASDYSQIELRVLAALSQVKELMQAFIHGRDIHRETAMLIFAVPESEVTDHMRSQAKTVNFGIIYGMSDFGLATQLGISRKEAKAFIERYFALFPGVRDFMDRTIKAAEQKGYVETVLGRRRYFPAIHSRNFNERNFAKRAAMNAPIQGSAADILKLAMIEIAKQLKENKMKTTMLLQVHDELIFNVPKAELETVEAIIRDAMTHAYAFDVPLAVGVATGDTWYEAK